MVANYKIGPLYTPHIVSKYPAPLGMIQNPANDGAGQWPGGALDPETNIFYIFSNMSYAPWRGLLPGDPARTDLGDDLGHGDGDRERRCRHRCRPANSRPAQPMRLHEAAARAPGGVLLELHRQAGRAGRQALLPADDWRCRACPCSSRPTAASPPSTSTRARLSGRSPMAETPDDVRNSPVLAGMMIARTGSQGKVGTLATKTLVIAGDGTATTGPDGKLGAWLRAYDKKTGRELGSVRMPTRVTGSPMTYALDGQQYIAVPLSGPGVAAQLVVYRLPA